MIIEGVGPRERGTQCGCVALHARSWHFH